MTGGLWAYDSGAGAIGSFLLFSFPAGLTFGLGQRIFTSVRSVWVRFAIALAFAAPAAFAGYHAMLGLTRLTMQSEGWETAFSVMGAVARSEEHTSELPPLMRSQTAVFGWKHNST